MTDLHTHILPAMDDGPKEIAIAVELLKQELRQGITCIALTPHYDPEREPLEHFLERREKAYCELSGHSPECMKLKRGCEVFCSTELLDLDLKQLCLEGTNILLLELPVLQKPAFLNEVLFMMKERGITPLIAHVERYRYVAKDPRILLDWIKYGSLIQVNAASVINDKFSRNLVRWGLCQIIASDAHSLQHRPPNLVKAMDTIARLCGKEKAMALESNGSVLFSGGEVIKGKIHVPRKVMGFWI